MSRISQSRISGTLSSSMTHLIEKKDNSLFSDNNSLVEDYIKYLDILKKAKKELIELLNNEGLSRVDARNEYDKLITLVEYQLEIRK